jgi:NADH:ubiquinone oxidoreductase subunit 3 (subunit A)
MGSFELMIVVSSDIILAFVVYYLLSFIHFKDIFKRAGLLQDARRDFYECGFKPQTQTPPKLSLQFIIICIFFLIYDIELVYLMPFICGATFSAIYDFLLISIFLLFVFVSLVFDYDRQALT